MSPNVAFYPLKSKSILTNIFPIFQFYNGYSYHEVISPSLTPTTSKSKESSYLQPTINKFTYDNMCVKI